MRNVQFEKRWEAKHPIYRLEAVLRGYTLYGDVPGCEPAYGLMSINDSVATTYYEKGDLKGAFDIGLKTIGSHSSTKEYIRNAETHCKKFVDLSKNAASSDLKNLSADEICKVTISFLDLFAGLFAYYNLSRPDYLVGIDNLIKKEIAIVEKDTNHHQELFAVLTAPELVNTYTQHELAILDAALQIVLRKNDIGTLSNQLESDFGWISTQEDNPALDEKYYTEKLNVLIKEGKDSINNKIKELKDKVGIAQEKKKEAVIRYKISKETQELADSVANLGHLRLQVRFWWTEGSFYAKALFIELNKRLGFDDKKIGGFLYSEYLLRDEYDSAIRGKKNITSDMVEARAKRSALLMLDKKISLSVGNDADLITKKYIKIEDFSSVKEIRGNIANKGIARGRAWVISPSVKSQSAKASEMKEGDILVAAMTRPQFIDAISKASAIVTDEGGITCHAAIVSRELNKPCVIGTKIATSVLKDGDMIEVDANNGIIKIL